MTAHWRLSAWYFAYFAFVGAYLPYFGLFLESRALTPSEIGIVMSLGQVMRMLVPTFWGWLSDRRGERTSLVRSSALLSFVAFAAYFVADDFLGLLAASLVLHLVWSGALPLVEALTFASLRDDLGAYGRIRLWGSIGFIVTVLGVGSLLDHFATGSLLWVAWAVLALVVVVAWSLRDPPLHQAVSIRNESVRINDPRVVALLLAGFFMVTAHGPLYVFYSIHLVGNGYGKSLTGVLWSLGVVAEILVFLAMPRLSRYFSLKKILLACFVLAVLRFILIGWYVDSLLLLLFAQLLHAATFGAHHAASVAALHQWFPARQQGRIQALYGSLSFGAGGMVGALVAGHTWEAYDASFTFGVAAAMSAVGLLVVAVGIPRGNPT